MENASKALIIAGAILLSILIIALGVFVFNQAKSAVGNTGLSDQEVAAFNSKFDSYEGKQKGSSVKALVNAVRNYNKSNDEAQYININNTGATDFATTEPAYNTTEILSATMYTVSFDYTNKGLICNINYTK